MSGEVTDPVVGLAQSVNIPEIINGLAGEIGWLGALVILGLMFLYRMERKRTDEERRRTDEMTERLIQQTVERLSEDALREEKMLRHFETITAYIKGRQG